MKSAASQKQQNSVSGELEFEASEKEENNPS